MTHEQRIKGIREIDQLDGLKDLANTYRSLRRWDKVLSIAEKLRRLGQAHYNRNGLWQIDIWPD